MEKLPRVLILGPGGSRGFLIIGALIFLTYSSHLRQVQKVVGVSIGAIIALLWVAGYSPFEIALECLDFSLLNTEKSLLDVSMWTELLKITERFGAFSNAKIQSRLEELLVRKFGYVPSLGQLEMLTGKTLVCVAVNVTTGRTEHLAGGNFARLSAVNAALMSSGVPFVLERMVWENEIYIDGALRDPCPVAKYDDGVTPILVLQIQNKINYPQLLAETGIAGLIKFTLIAYSSSIEELCERSERASTRACVYLKLHALTLDTTGITVSTAAKIKMLASGYVSAAIMFG